MKGVVIDSKVLVTCCVLSILGSLAYNILPVFLGTIGRHFALDDAQLGLLGSSSMAGAALTSLAAPFWMPRTNWKAVSIAGIAMLLLSILALAYTPKGALLQLYSILFVFGAGGIILFTLGLTILARSRDVERAYGIKMLAENIAATLFAYLLGTVIVMQFGFQGFLVAAALIYGAGLFFVGGLPRNFLKAEAAESTRESDASGLAGSNALAWAATVALLVWFAGFSAIWSFMERIGISAGLAHEAVDSILSLSIAASIVGALAATALGNRLGILGPLAAGLLLACSAVIALGASPGRIAFIFGASVFIGTLPFVLAYLLGLIAAVDRSGKVIVIVPLIMTAGGAFGPGILGLTVKGGDFTPGYWAFGCISIAVAAGSYWIERLHLSAPLDTVRSPSGPL